MVCTVRSNFTRKVTDFRRIAVSYNVSEATLAVFRAGSQITHDFPPRPSEHVVLAARYGRMLQTRFVAVSKSRVSRERDAPVCRLARSCDLRRPCAGGRAARRPSSSFLRRTYARAVRSLLSRALAPVATQILGTRRFRATFSREKPRASVSDRRYFRPRAPTLLVFSRECFVPRLSGRGIAKGSAGGKSETSYSNWFKASTESRESEEQGSSTTSPSEGSHPDESSGSSVLEMGSMDSAGSAHSGGPSCGLVSSLFPSSCRGRAEAFARRLHRRLTSLGGEDASQRDEDSSKPKETSWLRSTSTAKTMVNNASINHVLQHQPRHSPDTELCYDFDLDFEDGLSSPAEEATAAEMADLVVNPEVLKNHHDLRHSLPNSSKTMFSSLDSESGYVYASPPTERSPDSDSSDIFFDPESSDVEKAKNEVYFDPVTTSDSEMTTSNLSNGCEKAKNVPYHRRLDTNVERCEDTSESSSSMQRNSLSNDEFQNNELMCNSKDSNERSSLETTSLSHESLWSTFDESTMSLQDESPSRISGLATFPNRLPKSHSDSEIPVNGPSLVIFSELDRKSEEVEQGVDEVDFVNGHLNNGKLEDIKNIKNLETKDDSTDLSESTNEEELPYDEEKLNENTISLKVEENVGSETEDHSTYSSMISIPGALTLECPTGERVTETTMKNEVQLQIENGTVTKSNDEEKMCLLLKKLTTDSTVKDDVQETAQEPQEDTIEEEEEEERPPKIRRSSSLKTGKTPPGTPGRKKIVRFADVLGLDLADVRTFLDEIPKIPNSAYSDLIYDDIFQKDSSPVNSIPNIWTDKYMESRRGSVLPPRKLDRTLVPLFQQPGGLPNFLDLVRERRVCLENVLVQDPVSLCIQGTVRVINLDFHKSVHIRYTLNSWRNFSDLQATYVPNSCDGFSDKFSFVLYCHTLSIGQRLEFAVRFQCKGEQYWDNNAGANYCFQCLPASSAIGYIPITAQEHQPHDWSPMFY